MPTLAAVTLLGALAVCCGQTPCRHKYFSGGFVPRGAPFVADARRVGICQRHEGRDYYYTLFDTRYRIPVYAAYVPARRPADGARTGRRRTGRWYVEHSLAAAAGNRTQGMDQWPGSRGRVSRPLRDQLPYRQAVDDDYAESGYNRGHLNPNFLQHGRAARLATFTLTNAVPQDPCFNQGAWKRAEQLFDDVFVTFCHRRNGSVHALTGAVPNYPADGDDLRKTRTISCGDNDGGCSVWRPADQHDVYHRVNIPSRMWTAACCRYQEAGRPWALPYLHWGLNARDGRVLVNVGGHELGQLQLQLRSWYYDERGGDVALFSDGCATAGPEPERQVRAALRHELGDDPAVEVGGDLRELPARRSSRLLGIRLTQELDPLLLHALGGGRRMQQLTSRIYGLLAAGRYFVKCVDPLDTYQHAHGNASERPRQKLASPYCTLSMSYEPDEPVPDLTQLRPPFPVPAAAVGGGGGLPGVQVCGDPVPLGSVGQLTSANTVRSGSPAGCQLRLSARQLTFLTATLQAPRLAAGQHIDVYDGLGWLLRVNTSAPYRLMTSQHQLVLHLSSRTVGWSLNYTRHAGELASGDTVLLVERQTCASLAYPYRRRGWPHARFSASPGGAGRHVILVDSAPAGTAVASGRRVRLRTAKTTDPTYDVLYSSFTSNIYYERLDDSSKQLWRVGGLPRHGGQISLENVRYNDWYFGMKDESVGDGGVFKGQLCHNHVKWLIYKLPAEFRVQYGAEIAGFTTMVRNACAPGENKPLCML